MDAGNIAGLGPLMDLDPFAEKIYDKEAMSARRTGLCWESGSLKRLEEIQKTPNFSMSFRLSRLLLQMCTTMPTEVPSPMINPARTCWDSRSGLAWPVRSSP